MLHNICSAIGNTPLVQITFQTPAHIYAKLEYLNPGGSVKDRSTLYMIEQAEKNGILKPGGTIIDASSGNHAIALSMIGASKGYKIIVTTTEKISQEKLKTIQAYGAEVIVCKPTSFIEDPESYHSVACKIHKETPNSFMPNQYFNPVNADAHYHSTGAEIWKQTNGAITHLFAAIGTGGTITGTARYLKEKNPHVTIIGLDATNSFRATNGNPKPYKIEGMGIDFDNEVLDYNLIDEIINVADDDAFETLKLLARKHGILAGLTSGAVAWGAKEYVPRLNEGDIAVMIFGDSGRAYLTKNVY